MKNYIIPILVAVLGVSGVGYLIYKDLGKGSSGSVASSTTETASSTGKVIITDIQEVPEKPSIQAPSLTRPYTPAANNLEQNKLQLIKEYKALVTTLENNPQATESWLLLGAYRKNAGDLVGAEECWVYVSKIAPRDYVAFGNLADLYDFYFKNYPKAELNYKKVIALKPEYIAAYRSLHEMYRFRSNEPTKVVGILMEGLAKNPNNTDLLIPLAQYYADKSDVDNAKKYYLQARAEAEKLGKSQLVVQIDSEIAELK